MKYLLIACTLFLAGAAYAEMRLRNPNCPRCGRISWHKRLLGDWQCKSCWAWYDVITGVTSWRPPINSTWRELV